MTNRNKFESCDVVNRFKQTNFDLYKKMNEITHDIYPEENPDGVFIGSKPHACGSIWTHTMLVISKLMSGKKETSLELFLAGLLHDVGKTYSGGIKETIGKVGDEERVISKKRTFYGHQFLSSLMVPDILYNMYGKHYQERLDVRKIIELVNLHMFCSFGVGTVQGSTFMLSEKEIKEIERMFNIYSKGFYNDLLRLIEADSLGRITKDIEYDVTASKAALLKNIGKNFQPWHRVPYIINVDSYHQIKVLIGLPGSGKTTFRNELIEKQPEYVCISQDDIIERYATELGITYNKFFEPEYRDDLENAKFQMLDDLQKATKERKNIVIDMTNLSLKSRRSKLSSILSNIKNGVYVKRAIVFIRRMEELVKINSEPRGKAQKTISKELLIDMARKFSVPTGAEFDTIDYVFVD